MWKEAMMNINKTVKKIGLAMKKNGSNKNQQEYINLLIKNLKE